MNRELPTGTVTLLFTDIEGSTRLLEDVGASYGALLSEHHRLMRAAWAAHDGVEVSTEGDSFFVAFTDPASAVAAAVDAQRRLASAEWPEERQVRVRMGMHTGNPQIQDDTYWGRDVHYAARLASAAHGGQVLVSAAARTCLVDEQIQSLGHHALKDFLTPLEVFHLTYDGLAAEAFPAPRTLERGRTNLPAPAADLVGREAELNDLIERCGGTDQLVSLVGPGGSGKTRLAIEVGRRLVDHFDGVWFVPLEDVTESTEVMGLVARTLGLPEVPGVSDADRVLDHISGRRPLLLLDNAEHLLDGAAVIARLAFVNAGIRVLVTSQVPLHVSGESVLRLSPLRLPSGTEQEMASLAEVPAVALLLQRAHAAGVSLQLTAETAADVVRLCEQLEGMPLAIELAASRLNLLDPGALARRLEQGIDALGKGGRDLPARQRGLRAVLEWTSGLLSADHRHLLGNLSAFSGGFHPDLVEAAFGDVVEGLAALLDVGLVRRSQLGRLALRPPVRRFAVELLTPQQADDAHRSVAAALAELAEPFEQRWLILAANGLRALNPDAANISSSLDWARDNDPTLHARLAAATGWWMSHTNRAQLSRGHLDVALSRVDDARLRARCLQALAACALAAPDPTPALAAADAWRDAGDVDGELTSLIWAAELHSGEWAEKAAIVDRAVSVAATRHHDEELAWMLDVVRADVLWSQGDVAAADTVLSPLLQRTPPRAGRQFWAAMKMAYFALESGRAEEALALCGRAMEVVGGLDCPVIELLHADAATEALAALGRLDDAATSLAVCELAHAELSWRQTISDNELAGVRDQLDEARLSAGRQRAGALGLRGGLDWIGSVARERT